MDDRRPLWFVIWQVAGLFVSLVSAFWCLVLADEHLAGDPDPPTVLAFKLLFICHAGFISLYCSTLIDLWRGTAPRGRLIFLVLR